MSARNKAVGDWQERARKGYPTDERYQDGETVMAWIVVDQADMLDTKRNQRYVGGAYRVRLQNVPGMRTKTFYGESAWSAAERHARDAASACGDWRWGLGLHL